MDSVHVKSLFSIDIVVDKLNIKSKVQCYFPSIAFRILDFPTLIINHVEPSVGKKIKMKISMDHLFRLKNQLNELKDNEGSFPVKKGKSCLIQMDAKTLLNLLQNTPVYVMVVDIFHDPPKLVGNSTIPLDSTMQKLYDQISSFGLAVPSLQGEKGNYSLYNLMGIEIGTVSIGLNASSID